jgi:hypothetical protein
VPTDGTSGDGNTTGGIGKPADQPRKP